MPPTELFIVALPLAAVLALGIASTVRIERKRHRAAKSAREFAERHSWQYEEQSEGLTESFELPVTASKRLGNPHSRHVLRGHFQGREALSWQFSAAQRRTRGSSRSAGKGRHLSAVLYHLSAVTASQDLPSLTVTARSGGLASVLAGQPSQTTGDAAFDAAWWALAGDQGELRSLLDGELRATLAALEGELDGLATRGRTLVVWRRGRQLDGEIEAQLRRAAEFLEHFER